MEFDYATAFDHNIGILTAEEMGRIRRFCRHDSVRRSTA
jgi:hypothetical protein